VPVRASYKNANPKKLRLAFKKSQPYDRADSDDQRLFKHDKYSPIHSGSSPLLGRRYLPEVNDENMRKQQQYKLVTIVQIAIQNHLHQASTFLCL
jgi:hypothetical protein